MRMNLGSIKTMIGVLRRENNKYTVRNSEEPKEDSKGNIKADLDIENYTQHSHQGSRQGGAAGGGSRTHIVGAKGFRIR